MKPHCNTFHSLVANVVEAHQHAEFKSLIRWAIDVDPIAI
jgi:hypothetical protein